MEDQLIIELFFKRSENAIEELALKYEKLSMHIAKNILNNQQDAEECVNDAYLAVWNAIPPERPAHLQAYLCKIVRNLSLKRYQFNTAQKRNGHYDLILEELEGCIESDQDIENEVIMREHIRQVNAFLGSLKTKDRVIFMQRYWFGNSVSEIAKELKMNTNAVTVNLHRTRRKLKKMFEEESK